MLANIVYATVMVLLTTLAGLTLTPKKNRRVAKLALAYALGFTAISLAGLLAAALKTNIFAIQLIVLILLVGYYLKKKEKIRGITKDKKTVLAVFAVYLIFFLYVFSWIPSWMAGDTLERAIEIRMFLDQKDVPVSVFPFGIYFAQYPKAFQVYTFFWVKVLGIEITEALKITSILLSVYAPLGLYVVVSEFGGRKIALYSLVLACFGFIPHTAMLVWGGFTTLAGEMLLVSVVLAWIVDKRLLPVLFAGLLFSHPRLLFFAVLVLGSWIASDKLKGRNVVGVAIIALLLFVILAVGWVLYKRVFDFMTPYLILTALKEKTLTPAFLLTWIASAAAAGGLIIALRRKSPLDLLFLSWFFSIAGLALLVDFGFLSTHRMSVDRVITELYLPLSVLAGYFFSFVEGRFRVSWVRPALLAGICFFGIVSSAFFIRGYYESWGLPAADYDAFQWLKERGYGNTVLVNLDSTGMWAYPIAGIELVDPFMFTYDPPKYVKDLAANASSGSSLKELEGISETYEHTLIYVSNVSTTHPNYKPPFARFYGFYLNPKTSGFASEHYEKVYEKDGALIFEYVDGGK